MYDWIAGERLATIDPDERKRAIASLNRKYMNTIKEFAKYRAEYPYTLAKAAQILEKRRQKEAAKKQRKKRTSSSSSWTPPIIRIKIPPQPASSEPPQPVSSEPPPSILRIKIPPSASSEPPPPPPPIIRIKIPQANSSKTSSRKKRFDPFERIRKIDNVLNLIRKRQKKEGVNSQVKGRK